MKNYRKDADGKWETTNHIVVALYHTDENFCRTKISPNPPICPCITEIFHGMNFRPYGKITIMRYYVIINTGQKICGIKFSPMRAGGQNRKKVKISGYTEYVGQWTCDIYTHTQDILMLSAQILASLWTSGWSTTSNSYLQLFKTPFCILLFINFNLKRVGGTYALPCLWV